MSSRSRKIEAKNLQQIFALGIFWGEVSRYAATAFIVALSAGHSDITRFRPWSPIATGNHLDDCRCFGSSRTRRITDGKINTFKLGHPVFDSGIRWCMFPSSFCQNIVNFLRLVALQGKKKLDSSRLHVVEITRVS